MNAQQIPGFILSDSLELIEDRVVCKDCVRWEYVTKIQSGVSIRHSSRCDAVEQPKKNVEKPVKTSRIKQVATSVENGGNENPEDILEAYLSGHLSMSQAMNSDF